MSKFIIRNDDISADTNLEEIKKLCEICDKYGYQVMYAITPIGECQKVKARMTNDQIAQTSNKMFSQNTEVIEYLKSRNDLIAVHGLWHTHEPIADEVRVARDVLREIGFNPTYFVPPFNEGDYPDEVAGLKTCKLSDKERLEAYLESGTPKAKIVYLHSWRFNNKWFTFEMLEKCLRRLNVKLNLGCKWRRLNGFKNLDKIYGWLFQDGLPQYEDGSVDGITISHALMFLTPPEFETFAKEMYRILRKGGVVRITEDDTENPQSIAYQTGCVNSNPQCLTGPKMMREVLEKTGFGVHDVSRRGTHFVDLSLIQHYRGGSPNVFFIEGIK